MAQAPDPPFAAATRRTPLANTRTIATTPVAVNVRTKVDPDPRLERADGGQSCEVLLSSLFPSFHEPPTHVDPSHSRSAHVLRRAKRIVCNAGMQRGGFTRIKFTWPHANVLCGRQERSASKCPQATHPWSFSSAPSSGTLLRLIIRTRFCPIRGK